MSATEPHTKYSDAVVGAAREWLTDCYWSDLDSEDIDDLAEAVVIAGVNRHYEGGMAQLISDGLLTEDGRPTTWIVEYRRVDHPAWCAAATRLTRADAEDLARTLDHRPCIAGVRLTAH